MRCQLYLWLFALQKIDDEEEEAQRGEDVGSEKPLAEHARPCPGDGETEDERQGDEDEAANPLGEARRLVYGTARA